MSNERRDRELGMNRVIPRRDFLNGMSLAIGASLTGPNPFWAGKLVAAHTPYAPEKEPGYYPPVKTGMRGSHDGSWRWLMPCGTGRPGASRPKRPSATT
jgi:spermidine dehydrogenase